MRSLLIGFGLVGLFLGWNAPNHYPPWPAFHLEFFAGAGLLCLLATALWVPIRQITPLPRAAWLWCLLGALPVLQWLSGQVAFRGDGLLGLLYFCGAGMAVYAGAALARRDGQAHWLTVFWLTLVLSGLVAWGLGSLQWLRVPPAGWWAMELIDDRPYANFAQPNHFGLAMVMGSLAAVGLFDQHRIRRALLYVLWAFFFWGMLISESRAAGLATLVAVSFLAWRSGRSRGRLGLIDLIAFLACAGALLALFQTLTHFLPASQDAVRGSVQLGTRQAIWEHFLAAVRLHPWLGYGFNQAVQATSEVALQVPPFRNVIYAHNAALDLALWFGIPVALFLLALLVCWMRNVARLDIAAANPSQRQLVVTLCLVLLTQSMFEFPYAHAYFFIPVLLLVGTVSGAPAVRRSTPSERGLPYAVGLGAMLLFVGIAIDYFRLEAGFRSARFERAQFFGAAQFDPGVPAVVLDQLQGLNDSARIRIEHGISDAELDRLDRLARRFHILSIRLEFAQALALKGRMPEAEREMAIIRSVQHPDEAARFERYWRQWLRDHVASTGTAVPAEPRDNKLP